MLVFRKRRTIARTDSSEADRAGLGAVGEGASDVRDDRDRQAESSPTSDRLARRIGATLASLAALGPPGWARADNRVTRTAQRPPSHDPSAHATRDDAERLSLPPALPTRRPAWGLPSFEQMALARNPTLRQAAAQLEAALSRSFQAGLYPNPTIGYVQEQIGALGESTPTSRGVVARGKPSPGELVGGFVQQEIITGGKLGSGRTNSPRRQTPPAGSSRPRSSACSTASASASSRSSRPSG